jgi:hypothetical protein
MKIKALLKMPISHIWVGGFMGILKGYSKQPKRPAGGQTPGGR